MTGGPDKPGSKSGEGAEENPELKDLQELYELMLREGLESVELARGDSTIRLERVSPEVSTGPSPSISAPPPTLDASQWRSVKSPLAGFFYRTPAPNSAPYVQEGDVIEVGKTLCIVEAMKVMNEIKADVRCRIVKILVENGRPVSAGQDLFFVDELT